MLLRAIVFFVLLGSSICLAQSVNIGVRLESLYYSYELTGHNHSKLKIIPLPISAYIKAGIFFLDKYELELKAGAQLEEIFTGFEYALTAKYRIYDNIFPELTYLMHFNSGDSRTGSGAYNHKMDFIGIGIEAKLVKSFGMDLIYYFPVGERELEYTLDSFGSGIVTTSKIQSLIKLGFIINIYL